MGAAPPPGGPPQGPPPWQTPDPAGAQWEGRPTAGPVGQWPAPGASSDGNGIATGALVCGILGLLAGLFGILVLPLPFAVLLGVAAVIMGIVGLRRAAVNGRGRGQSISGIVTGAVGLAAALAWGVFLVLAWGTIVERFGDPFQDPEGFMDRVEEEQRRQQEEQP